MSSAVERPVRHPGHPLGWLIIGERVRLFCTGCGWRGDFLGKKRAREAWRLHVERNS